MQIAINNKKSYIRRDSLVTTLWEHWLTHVDSYTETGRSIAEAPILQRNIISLAQRFNSQPKTVAILQKKLDVLGQLQAGSSVSLFALTFQNKINFSADDLDLLFLITKAISPEDYLFALVFITYEHQVLAPDKEFFAKTVLPACGLTRRDTGNYPLLAQELISGRSPRHMVSFLISFIKKTINQNMNSEQLNSLYQNKTNTSAVFERLFKE